MAEVYNNNKRYSVTNGVLHIHPGVTMIQAEEFKGCNRLIGVIIPASVKEIGREAFCGCKGLKQIVILGGIGINPVV